MIIEYFFAEDSMNKFEDTIEIVEDSLKKVQNLIKIVEDSIEII